MQTPGAPPEPVQGPFTEERGARALTKPVESKEIRKTELSSCILLMDMRRLPRLIKCCIAQEIIQAAERVYTRASPSPLYPSSGVSSTKNGHNSPETTTLRVPYSKRTDSTPFTKSTPSRCKSRIPLPPSSYSSDDHSPPVSGESRE